MLRSSRSLVKNCVLRTVGAGVRKSRGVVPIAAISTLSSTSFSSRVWSRNNTAATKHSEPSYFRPRRGFAASAFKTKYEEMAKKREEMGVVPLPLDVEMTSQLVDSFASPPAGEEEFMLYLLSHRVPAGVDDAARVKASFLNDIVKGKKSSPILSKEKAIEFLGQMYGGYNVMPLVETLKDAKLGPLAVKQLSRTLLMFDAFNDVNELRKAGNKNAEAVMQSWANADWFLEKPKVAEKITVTVFKVPGETNTDDLSPAPDAWSRPDIPLHATAMLKNPREGLSENIPALVTDLKKKGFPLAYVGDVVGTGSSRKSATNSVLWYMGDDIPNVPNKRSGGVCIGGKIAPIFYNTMEDSGAMPLEMDVNNFNMGDVIDIFPYKGIVTNHETGKEITRFTLRSDVLLDEIRAGGRIPLIIGRGLTSRARDALGLPASDVFKMAKMPDVKVKGYTLAQKMVGKACGLPGVVPDQYCEPLMTTVGSQDTTGPMTRDELKDLACLGFSADLVMQSFCHTAAYPKPVDVTTHKTLPEFIQTRGGVALRPKDGIIHSWLNRMLIPDTVGTGGDSHTRFPLGISFPAGSGLVAFAAATGTMPLDMPESVLVRFNGKMNPGITLRDLVHAIPYFGIQKGLLTVEKKGKKNVFSGRILEIEGLEHLKCEQAFELSDASAERSAAGCTITLDVEPVKEYINSNIVLLKWMIQNGYGDARTLTRRIARMMAWLENPKLMRADKGAEYAAVLDVDVSAITEPILCCPNDPDDAKLLSQVQNDPIQEVFIGSCMTNIGHFRAAGRVLSKLKSKLPTTLWICPPTKMDEAQLKAEGYYEIFERVGARLEVPGCSLCMGNQARVADKANVVSTSTRNFPNRMGAGARVYLASAELAAVTAALGRIPTKSEYLEHTKELDVLDASIYKYLNFHLLDSYVKEATKVPVPQQVVEDARRQA